MADFAIAVPGNNDWNIVQVKDFDVARDGLPSNGREGSFPIESSRSSPPDSPGQGSTASENLKSAVILTTLFAVYFLSAKLGLALAFVHPSATAVWPPTGIALAAFLVLGYRVWPAIFLGAFLVNLTTEGSLSTSVGIATGNTLEGLVGAYMVNRWARGAKFFDHSRDVFKFAIFAGMLSTLISATFGVTSLWLGGYVEKAVYGVVWLTWWLGDAAGALILAPPLLLWTADPRLRWDWRRSLEAAALLLLLLLVGGAMFLGLLPITLKNHPLSFLAAPPLLWVAFRFGQRETATATFLLSGMAVWGTLQGFGPFARENPNESLLLLQAFMTVTAVMGLVLAAAVGEGRRGEEVRRRLAAIVESTDDAITGVTLDGVIINWNPAAERIYGYTAKEVVGRPVDLLVPPERQDETGEMLQRMGRGERVEHFETIRIRKDGTKIQVSVTVSLLRDDTGKIKGVSIIARDITRRKRMEQLILQRNKQQAVLDLVSGLSDTLLNKLNAALLYLDFSKLTEEKLDSNTGRSRYLDEFNSCMHEIADVIRTLRINVCGTEETHEGSTDIAEMLTVLPHRFQQIDFRLHLPERLPPIQGSPALWESFDALCENAMEAVKRPGEVPLVDVSANVVDGGQALEVRFKDHGVGMSEDVASRIFTPFFTTKGTLKAGLGLWILYQTMERLRGQISVSTSPGEGTEFSFLFPVHPGG